MSAKRYRMTVSKERGTVTALTKGEIWTDVPDDVMWVRAEVVSDPQRDREAYLRYLGVLGLLSECSPHVDEETRESIEQAFRDAVKAHPMLRWRRILDRVVIEPHDQPLSGDAVGQPTGNPI